MSGTKDTRTKDKMPRKTKEQPMQEEQPMTEVPASEVVPEAPAPAKKKKARKASVDATAEAEATSEAPKKKKARKADDEATSEAPKKKKKPRAKSAYQLFQQHKAASKQGTVAFADFSKECAAEWKTMTDEAKKPWVDDAEARKAEARGPPKPKRPPTAFFKFLADFRAKLVGVVPPKEVASKAGAAWRDLAPEAKEAWRVA